MTEYPPAQALAMLAVVVRVSVVVGTSRGPSAGCQQPGWPWFPQQPDRVRTFLQLFASARRTFVGNGASYVLKLAKKAFPLDRAIVIAILLGPCAPLYLSSPRV
jgi:hypothetical protein